MHPVGTRTAGGAARRRRLRRDGAVGRGTALPPFRENGSFLYFAGQPESSGGIHHRADGGKLRSNACAHHLLREHLVPLYEGTEADAQYEDRRARADGDPRLQVAPLEQREPLLRLDHLRFV